MQCIVNNFIYISTQDGEIIGGWLYRLHALSALGVEELSKIASNIIIAMLIVMRMVKVVMMITTI